jgi:adenosylcobinamide-phosphate synthase
MVLLLGPAAIALGFLLDLLLGDPPGLPHPVRGMGFLIARGEGILRKLLPGKEGAAGTLLVVLVTASAFFLSGAVLFFTRRINPWAGFTAELILCWLALSPRALQIEAMKVYRKAVQGDLAGARKAVSMIVGRDTAELSMEQVIKATVETVAENLCDGVIAPLFFLALGGPPLGMLYKAINTLDSMIGYKNDRYLVFGRSAAKLDDLANRLPARLSAGLLIVAAVLLGFDGKNAARIYRRDRNLHTSPNSGHPEAACAGALGISLGGRASYFGAVHEKAVLGDAQRPVTAEDIRSAIRLMYAASILILPAACVIRLAVGFLAAP